MKMSTMSNRSIPRHMLLSPSNRLKRNMKLRNPRLLMKHKKKKSKALTSQPKKLLPSKLSKNQLTRKVIMPKRKPRMLMLNTNPKRLKRPIMAPPMLTTKLLRTNKTMTSLKPPPTTKMYRMMSQFKSRRPITKMLRIKNES